MSRPVALVLRPLGLGDFLTGLPALRLIRRLLPDHQLVLAAGIQFQPLLPLISYLDELLPAAELQPVRGLDRPVDIGIDLHGNGIASRRIVAQLRPRRLVGFGNPVDGLPGPPWQLADEAEHEVRRWCRLVQHTLGSADDQPTGPVDGCVAVPGPAPGPELTVLHPGAAYRSRRWPAERFGELARRLSAAGHRLVVTGTGREAALASQVAGNCRAELRLDLPLLELFRLVAHARLVISGDTGIAHVASNYGSPSITLFGPVSPAHWGPPADPRHVVLWHGDGTGNPHGNQVDPALLRISVDEVLAAVARLDAWRAEIHRPGSVSRRPPRTPSPPTTVLPAASTR
jgi:ADP-heptose:LPS heptosyltransferase